MKPRIYNRNMELVGVLRNANAIGYTRSHNNLHTATFELPQPDPQNALCDTHFVVDIFDGEVSKGKYRILDEPDSDITSNGSFLKYSCEHVISFLLNDVIDGHLEAGGTGKNTRHVIEQILAKQSVARWQLGDCDFAHFYQYSWENTNLLDALFSIPTCFEEKYHWTYDTSAYPWTINLVAQDTDRSCEVRRKRNMQNIKRSKDSSALCTRLYCKGSGEGINQLGISSVNPTGKPYIDADTIGTYGILCSHFIDLTVNDASTLIAKGKAILEEVKHPRYTYTAKAADLSKITGFAWDEFDEGKFVHLIDEEKGLDLDAMIIEVSKSDVDGDPLNVDITISNKPTDVASAIEDLSRRAAIHAQYSQGATNLYAQQYADNADEDHPAAMRFYIPHGAVNINQILLSWKYSAFRAYETGAASGGGKTTGSGGGVTSGASTSGLFTENSSTLITTKGTIDTAETQSSAAELMSGSAGAVSTGDNTLITMGETSLTTSSAGAVSTGNNTLITMGETSLTTDKAGTGATGASAGNTGTAGTGKTGAGTGHYHTITNHRHSYASGSAYTGYTQPGATTESSHTHSGPSHSHGLGSHTHTGPEHQHAIDKHYHSLSSHTHTGGGHQHTIDKHYHSLSSHTHTGGGHQHEITPHKHGIVHDHYVEQHKHEIPQHTHSVDSHTHSIPDHTHGITYGIYEGTTADSSTIKVDGNVVPSGSVSANEMDIIAWLSKDANGKITRGAWHTVEIVPNKLTRIESNLFIQTFITSYDGGNY